MRLDTPQMKPGAQRIDGFLGQRHRFPPRPAHNRQGARDVQHAHPLCILDVDKQVAWKQGKIEGYPRAVAPFAFRAVKWQILFDLSLRQMLRYTLFMPRDCVDGTPFRFENRIRRKLRQKAIFRSKSPLPNTAHGRIILVLVELSQSSS
jgi:hypothetical protein